MDSISNKMKSHYENTFRKFGANCQGVDWGTDVYNLNLRYEKMLDIVTEKYSNNYTILDVGCGYGGIYEYLVKKGINFNYTGLDVVKDMIDYAQNKHTEAQFIQGDFLEKSIDDKFDYVVCNGIFTQKLNCGIKEMDLYCKKIIEKMYDICKVGIAFNMMTNKVNYMTDNLFYTSPVELLSYCFELTNKIKLDHTYPLYEYTIYLYKKEQ